MALRIPSILKSKIVPELRVLANNGFATAATKKTSTLSDFDMQHKSPVIRKQKPLPVAEYGGRHAVTMLPGGGIGPELMGYVKEIFRLVYYHCYVCRYILEIKIATIICIVQLIGHIFLIIP